ncbi:MAG TPA: hypothetical protein VGN21_18235 [Stellaceae bacterium]
MIFRQPREEFLNPVVIALLDAGSVLTAAAARIDERGFVVLEFRPLRLRELPAGPVIDIGELLIEVAEPGILAYRLFVGGTGVAAIEALPACWKTEASDEQQHSQPGGENGRRQQGTELRVARHFCLCGSCAGLSPR